MVSRPVVERMNAEMENEPFRSEQEEQQSEKREELAPVEKFYERFRGVSIRHLDIFIAACIGALVLVVLLGVLDSRGIL